MNYIIIDTSGEYLTVIYKLRSRAESEQDSLLSERRKLATLDRVGIHRDSSALMHSQTLMPAIAEILGEKRLKAIDCIGVVVGPGSFTGVRIGITTAKAFAFCDPRLKLVAIELQEGGQGQIINDKVERESQGVANGEEPLSREQIIRKIFDDKVGRGEFCGINELNPLYSYSKYDE